MGKQILLEFLVKIFRIEIKKNELVKNKNKIKNEGTK